MKYLKKWKLFENHDEIHKICKDYRIENYTINGDGSIDVDGNVDLTNKGLTKLPLHFNRVSGEFDCGNNQLTSLEGAPKSISGDFWCNNNQLTSLEGAPKEVGGGFYCYDNKLTSLEGAPKEVGGDFYCNNNQLTSLEGAPKSISGDFYCNNNQLTSLDHLPEVSGDIYMANNPVYPIVYRWIGTGSEIWERWEYFQDLNIIQGNKVILERLEEFHEVMEIPMPNLKEIKRYYTIVE